VPILSSAMAALVIDPGAFQRGSDFAAALVLVPRRDGTGGKSLPSRKEVQLGPISKCGNGYRRRLLVKSLASDLTRWGATSLIKCQRVRRDPWVAKLLATKPRKVVAVALANKLARIGWVLMTRQEDFHRRRRLEVADRAGSESLRG
jgi:transposase